MPAPVVPSQFCDAVPSASSDLCTRLTRFFNIAGLICDLVSWAFNADGSISDEVITELTAEVLPPGTLIHSAASNMGTGWLLCNGQAVSRTTYSNLFAAIGTRYGTGDGSSTFNVPNGSGRSLITAGSGNGLTSRDINTINVGSETVTMALANLIDHQHDITTFSSGATGGDGGDILNEPDPGVERTHTTEIEGGGDPPTPMDIVHPCLIAYLFIKV